MKAIKFCLFAIALGMITVSSASAQDYVGMLDQMIADIDQQNAARAQFIVNSYRQQTGDWNSSPQQILAHVEAQSRMNNPQFYNNLRQREAMFQQQQAQYRQHANAMLDNSFNSYMNRSNMQHQAHQDYVRQSIWERDNYDWNGNTYELPNYDPGFHEAYDGTTFYQDDDGDYYHWDG
ncbi:MAG: hypothetical protein AAF456_10920 [Planctomycetota bacterium]